MCTVLLALFVIIGTEFGLDWIYWRNSASIKPVELELIYIVFI